MGGGKIVKNNLLIGTAFLSLALGAASCTNDSEQLTDSRTAPMSIQVANHIASRGLITTGTLPADDYGIGVTLVNKSDKAPYDGQTGYANNQWKTANGTTWDIVEAANPNLTGTEGVAVAYYPYSSSATTYTAIPVESASQTDYMYSRWSNDLTNASPEATFTMQHALAAVRVKLVASANYTGDKSASAVTISSDGFMATASLDASTGILSSKDGAGAEHTQDNLGLTLDATGKDVDFLVIPADAPDDINFIAAIGGKQYAATVTPSEALAQGLIHTYTLTLSAAGMRVSTVEVTPWGNGQTGSDELKPAPMQGTIDLMTAANGVYAVAKNGKGVDVEKADKSCIAVALIVDKHKFMIEKNGENNAVYGGITRFKWGLNTDISDIINYSTVNGIKDYGCIGDILSEDYTTWTTGALSDFNGMSNSLAMVESTTDTQYLSGILDAFNKATDGQNQGKNDWYIPACGQLALIYLAKDEINEALENIEGATLSVGGYFSSTEGSNGCFCDISFTNGGVYSKSSKSSTFGSTRFIRDIK